MYSFFYSPNGPTWQTPCDRKESWDPGQSGRQLAWSHPENMWRTRTSIQDCLAAKPTLGQVLRNTDFSLDPDSRGIKPSWRLDVDLFFHPPKGPAFIIPTLNTGRHWLVISDTVCGFRHSRGGVGSLSVAEMKVRPSSKSHLEAGAARVRCFHPWHRITLSLGMTSVWQLAFVQGTRHYRRLRTLEESALTSSFYRFKNWEMGTSLWAQLFRILLPMQGTQVPPQFREDPTSWGAAKLVHNNY